MKTILKELAASTILISITATASAITTWNYFISDAGDGNSLLTWNVSGDLTTQTGMVLLQSLPYLDIPINAPGIFNDIYAGNSSPQAIPTPDGSLFYNGDIYWPIVGFIANNAPDNGNDTFSLLSTPLLHGKFGPGPGTQFNYMAEAQSVLLSIDYSDFNPGTYQSEITAYSPLFIVNLTVGPVPEPPILTLTILGGLGLLQIIGQIKSKKAVGITKERPCRLGTALGDKAV